MREDLKLAVHEAKQALERHNRDCMHQQGCCNIDLVTERLVGVLEKQDAESNVTPLIGHTCIGMKSKYHGPESDVVEIIVGTFNDFVGCAYTDSVLAMIVDALQNNVRKRLGKELGDMAVHFPGMDDALKQAGGLVVCLQMELGNPAVRQAMKSQSIRMTVDMDPRKGTMPEVTLVYERWGA